MRQFGTGFLFLRSEIKDGTGYMLSGLILLGLIGCFLSMRYLLSKSSYVTVTSVIPKYTRNKLFG